MMQSWLLPVRRILSSISGIVPCVRKEDSGFSERLRGESDLSDRELLEPRERDTAVCLAERDSRAFER